jgi:hypothetical protein
MKKSILLILLLLTTQLAVLGQSAREKRLQKAKEDKAAELFEDDAAFKVREVPEEFKDESVVLMAQKIYYEYGVSNNTSTKGVIRKLIKLQDKAAIEGFASIDFADVENNVTGIRIIKANGSVQPVDLSKAVGIDEETRAKKSTLFGTYERGSFKYKKVALENLEVGDFIDYVTSYEGSIMAVFMPSCSNLMHINFQEEYPILNFNVEFKVRRGFYINAISLKGAPKLKLDAAKSDKRFQTFKTSAKNLAPYQNTDWAFNDVVLPILKFQICISKKNSKGDEIVGEMGVIKDRLTPTEIQQSVAAAYNYLYHNQTVKMGSVLYYKYRYNVQPFTDSYVKWAKRYHRNVKSDLEMFELLYFRIRYDVYSGEFKHLENVMNDEFFATLIHSTMKELKFNSKLLAAPGRQITTREGILSRRELYWLVAVGVGKNQKIIYPISLDRVPSDSYWRLSGVEAQVIDTDLKKTPENYKPKYIKLPEDVKSNNTVSVNYQLSITDDLNLQVKSNQKYTGQNRLGAPWYYTSAFDVSAEDKKLANIDKEKSTKASERRAQAKVADVKAFDFEEQKAKQRKRLESDISSRYKLIKYEDFKLVSSGRSIEKPVMEVEQSYVVGELVTKVGNNYLLDIGKLFGSFDKQDTSIVREFPIQYDYPMQVSYKFELELPQGYQAEGLSTLDFNYETSIGVFKASATQADGKVFIQINRDFDRPEMSKDEWLEFATFMNLAFDYSQKKLLLKKI